MQLAYKVYTAVLTERLREDVESKTILPPSQTGFKRWMGTIDQIFVLNYLINKRVAERSRRMVVMFIDTKVAFDSVDRDILVERMKKRRSEREAGDEMRGDSERDGEQSEGKGRRGRQVLDGQRIETEVPIESVSV